MDYSTAKGKKEKLSKLGNPLEKFHTVIDFEFFREELESKLINQNKKSKAGSKPYDVVMMFKIILLKLFYNLSDEQAEFLCKREQSREIADPFPHRTCFWIHHQQYA